MIISSFKIIMRILFVLFPIFYVSTSYSTFKNFIFHDELLEEDYIRNMTCKHEPHIYNDGYEIGTCNTELCSRRIVDGLFSVKDIEKLLMIVNKGLSTRNNLGGPTILDINTGYVRDSEGLKNLFYSNEDIYTPDDFQHYGRIINVLKNQIKSYFGISNLYFTAPTFITRINGNEGWEAKDVHDEYWHVHADMNNTAHYHYSGLLYLNTYGIDFTGGRLIFYNDEEHHIEEIIEPKQGRALFFTSGPENPHNVEQVTSGERFVLSFWFTCDPAREFEIFLDGKSHVEFSHNIRSKAKERYIQQQNLEKKNKETEL